MLIMVYPTTLANNINLFWMYFLVNEVIGIVITGRKDYSQPNSPQHWDDIFCVNTIFNADSRDNVNTDFACLY